MGKSWATMFQPMMDKHNLTERPAQTRGGEAVIKAIECKKPLIASLAVGSGKSFLGLIPAIDAIKSAPADTVRVVVSTETNVLLDQYVNKDLPNLHAVYGGFTFSALKGRSNYICFDAADSFTQGNTVALAYLNRVRRVRGTLKVGDRAEIEKAIGSRIPDTEWSQLSGSDEFCPENQCGAGACMYTRARAKAQTSNIVVTNNALLAIDLDMRINPAGMGGTIFDDYHILIADEAHTLEQSLIDFYTVEMKRFDVWQRMSRIAGGVNNASRYSPQPQGMAERLTEAVDDLPKAYDELRTALRIIHKHEEWQNVSSALHKKIAYESKGNEDVVRAVNKYNNVLAPQIQYYCDMVAASQEYLQTALPTMIDNNVPKNFIKEVRKGITASRDLLKFLQVMAASMLNDTSVVIRFGIPYVLLAEGYVGWDGGEHMILKMIPLDVSKPASELWKNKASVIMSGTLRDLTTGTFEYTVKSLGIPSDHMTVHADTSFDLGNNQVLYVTPAKDKIDSDIAGTRHSFNEMVDLILAANGRTLVLFTAKKELQEAAERLRALQEAGHFPYTLLVQEPGVDKDALAAEFKRDTHSVLLGSRSFMTGFDAQGETLSLVILPKFPLAMYNTLCKEQIKWWRSKRYNTFYEYASLTLFQQAAGRLIRSSFDRGVVALLDQRLANTSENVYRTARVGVQHLGSPVTQNVEDVRNFLTRP